MPSEMVLFHVSSAPFLPVEQCSPWWTSFARNADSNKFHPASFHSILMTWGFVSSLSIAISSCSSVCSPRILHEDESSLFEVSFDFNLFFISLWYFFRPHRPRHVHAKSHHHFLFHNILGSIVGRSFVPLLICWCYRLPRLFSLPLSLSSPFSPLIVCLSYAHNVVLYDVFE